MKVIMLLENQYLLKKQFNEDVRTTTDKKEFTNWSNIVVPENSNNLIQSYQNFPSLK